jgi:glycosyltransferase involved in cell wall biosynthesis
MIISHKDSNALGIDVSVIIPTYNRISMLEEALASVFSQEFDGVFEVIVADDNSQDGTPEIVATKYPDVHLIRLEQNLGHGAARNRAIGSAKGKYIAFLDSDDLWKPDYLKVQIASLEDQDRSFAVSGLEIWDVQADQRRIVLQKPDLDSYMSPIHQLLLIGKTFILTPSSVVFSRAIFDEVGLFEERFRVGVDIDFYLRCLGAGFNMIFTEHLTVIKREGSSDQLTGHKNLKPREKSVFSRIHKYYHLYGAKNPNKAPPIKHIYIENHLWYTNAYFYIGYPLDGLRSSLSAAHNGAPSLAFFCATKSILSYTKKEIKHSLKGGLKFFQHCTSSFGKIGTM